MPKATPQDAELILKLYELRRDPEMRRARSFLLSEFNETDWEALRRAGPGVLTSVLVFTNGK